MEEKITFHPHKKGSTLLKQEFVFQKSGSGGVNITGAIIKLQMKTSKTGPVEYEMSTLNGKIIIVDALGGKFETVQENISIPAFDYICAVQIELPNGVVHEIITFTWPINQDIV